jgi:hypothetical protein
MNTLALLLNVIEPVGVPALRIGFTIALLLVIGAGVFIYHRRDQLFGAIRKSRATRRSLGIIAWKKSF